MYHPAKVEQVVDDGVAVVETWDRNVFTLRTRPDAELSLAEGAVVLVEYYPDERFDMPTARQEISHVLDDATGQQIWAMYQELFDETQQPQTDMMQMPNQPFEGGYIG